MKQYKHLFIAIGAFIAFVIFTILVKNIDVKVIGDSQTNVGFASMNKAFWEAIGVHESLYKITDIASIVTIPVGFVFLIIGIVQWVKRKNILKVDGNILAMGCFYILTFAAYLTFQFLIINYRPVLVDGKLEASYPSSTTVLAITVLFSCIDGITRYLKNKKLIILLVVIDIAIMLFLIIGRVLCGYHWLSDIIGGLLLATFLVESFYAMRDIYIDLQKKAELKKVNQ